MELDIRNNGSILVINRIAKWETVEIVHCLPISAMQESTWDHLIRLGAVIGVMNENGVPDRLERLQAYLADAYSHGCPEELTQAMKRKWQHLHSVLLPAKIAQLQEEALATVQEAEPNENRAVRGGPGMFARALQRERARSPLRDVRDRLNRVEETMGDLSEQVATWLDTRDADSVVSDLDAELAPYLATTVQPPQEPHSSTP